MESRLKYSVIIPVYNNEDSIERLLEALAGITESDPASYEVIFVIDGSPDRSGEMLNARLARLGCAARIAFHSRNYGSFAAIRTGMGLARGEYVAAMAADLQEPPSLVSNFFSILTGDEADVVFGVRETRDDPVFSKLLSNLFWGFYRRYVIRDMPQGGVDMFACNAKVLRAVLSIEEPNSSLIAQLFWVGFRRAFVPYARQRREAGKSAWRLSRKLRYMMDSILAFTDLPIMIVLWVGMIGITVSTVLGIVTVIARVTGIIQAAGYASTFIMLLFFGSLMLAVQGILGCYIWRTAENTRRRPLSIIAHIIDTRDDG